MKGFVALLYFFTVFAAAVVVVHSELECTFDITPFDEDSVVEPVSVVSLDLNAFAGRWYQMYASMIPNKTYERSGMCVTADYSFVRSTPHALYVRNTMTTNTPDSAFTSVRALALHRHSVSTQQGLFQFLMGEDEVYTKADASHDFNTCVGNYRVVALGKMSKQTGKYAWAVVSTPFKSSLFIIARNVKEFQDEHARDVLSLVEGMGFNKKINSPRETYQGDDCQYVPDVIID